MCVDVRYMLGGIDKCIELEYVKEHNLDDQDNVKRGRSSRSKRLPGVSNALVDGDHIQPKLTKEEDADSEAPSRKKTKKKAKTKTKAKNISKKNAFKDASSKANKKVQTSKEEPK
eukprot:111276_1